MAVFGLMIASVVLVCVIGIPVIIGVLVYRDAKDRGMNPVPWVMVAVLVPNLIGVIIYLVVRTNYPNLHCANCGVTVQKTYAVCPQCGAQLQKCCPQCGAPVQAGWRRCSQCGGELVDTELDTTAVIERKTSRTLVYTILAVLGGLLLLVLALAIWGVFFAV